MAVQRKALSDEDIRTNQQFAKLFEDTIKVSLFWLLARSLCQSVVLLMVATGKSGNLKVQYHR